MRRWMYLRVCSGYPRHYPNSTCNKYANWLVILVVYQTLWVTNTRMVLVSCDIYKYITWSFLLHKLTTEFRADRKEKVNIFVYLRFCCAFAFWENANKTMEQSVANCWKDIFFLSPEIVGDGNIYKIRILQYSGWNLAP